MEGYVSDSAHGFPGVSIISNSLVAGNKTSLGPDMAGKLTTEGYNLIQSTAGIAFLDPDHKHLTDLTNIPLPDIKIASYLRLNGSTTTKTHALLPGSPAIDAVPLQYCQLKIIFDSQSRIYTDQRGMKRPDKNESACDIGAYEYVDAPT